MYRNALLTLVTSLAMTSACLQSGVLSAAEDDIAGVEFFEKEIRPLLVKRCYECHGPEAKRLEGGLLMNSRASLLKGGDTDAAIVPGQPSESLLIDAITYEGDYEMPPKGKMPEEEIALLTKWVEMGAPWPAGASDAPDPRKKFDLEDRKATHWAWQPIADPAPPEVKQKDWPLDPIDQFILAKLEDQALAPSDPADATALLRRLYFDIIGLPPSEAEVELWTRRLTAPQREAREGDGKTDALPAGSRLNEEAIENLVDELLASPQFGERWGRHWLDLMRYAESRGHEFDAEAPNAWEYRDYVIRALNADVPYDQFVTEHIAGDLLPQPRRHPDEGFNESIIATGFWHLGEWVHSPVDIRQDECDRLDNQIDVFSKTFMGMTVACARCHDHKFDAISQRDYYAIAGYVQSSAYRLARFETLEHNRDIAQQLHDLRQKSGQEVAKLTAQSQRPAVDRLDEYLLAAREAIITPRTRSPEQHVATIAKQREIDNVTLATWIAYLHDAKDRVDDPMHLWAQLSHDANGEDQHVAEVAAPIIDAIAKGAVATDDALGEAELIFDYGAVQDEPWMIDGSAFGVRPMHVGDPRLTNDAQSPLAGFATYGAARRDTAFRDLKLAPGAMNDHGAAGNWQRVGQSVGTPTFTVKEGPVHYLVRGAGRAFAVVDSHRLIQGPLHGEVLFQWKNDNKDQVRWVTQNLNRHQGHRVHIEFSPNGGGDLEILMVAQGPRPAGIPVDTTGSALLATHLSKNKATSLAAIASAYQRMFGEVNAAVEHGKLAASKIPAATAAIASWMIEHPALCNANHANAKEPVAAAGKSYVEEEKRLAAQVKNESRVAMAMWDGYPENEQLLIRGNHGTTGGLVPRHTLTALGGTATDSEALKFGSGRLQLAKKMVDPANPLTSRVMVNRIWHHLTSRGIAPVTDNFGVLGMEPTHPELLDHLATRFMREGWSVKRMIKTIVLSRTYQMSSHPIDAMEEKDPSNQWLHRMRIRRLEGETIRDAMLAISGRLDENMHGRPVPVYLTPFMTGRGRPGGGPLDGNGRRSIYISVRRNFLSPMMLAFDMPQPSAPVGRRTVSNVPAQALIMMNDPLVVQQAELWAKRLLTEDDLTPRQRVEKMYLQAFARKPSEIETADAMAFLVEQGARYGVAEDQATTAPQPWTDLCHVMFNVKEFIFVN